LISLVDRAAYATGLRFVAPLFAEPAAPRSVFAGAAATLPLVGLTGAAVAARRP
jgi:hypothetical protein